MREDRSPQQALFGGMVRNARARFEFGDALLFLYVLVFVRQYLWVVGENWLAWLLTIPLTAVIWFFYVSTKPLKAEPAGRQFWLIVCLPLLFIYALRLPFPDTSFDVLNYRLLHAERSLRGSLFMPGDFLPTPAPYNPAPDTLTGLFRHALGYRLGTVVNFFALLWTGHVLGKILRPFVAGPRLRAVCVLLTLLAEHVLFEANTYMVDLLALPLLFEVTYLALRFDESDRQTSLVHAALLLGICGGLKLTNFPAIAPLVIVFAYQAVAGKQRLTPRALAKTSLVALAAFAAPFIPFAIYLWRATGNPFFPLANGYFKSFYWPTNAGWDSRWGPLGTVETLAWPILAAVHPSRHSELAVYSGRLGVGFVAAVIGLALAWREKRARLLCAILLAGSLFWSAGGMGFSRYGLYLELLAGVVALVVASVLFRTAVRTKFSWARAVALLVVLALAGQSALACRYFLGHGWGTTATLFSNWRSYKYESRFLLRDHELRSFLSQNDRALLSQAPAWVESGIKSTGIEVLLNANVPIVAVNHQEYFYTRESKTHFVRAIDEAPGETFFSLCLPEDLEQAKADITRRKLEISGVTPVQIPFFSSRQPMGMMLIEIAHPRGAARDKLQIYVAESPLDFGGYQARIIALNAPTAMRAGEQLKLNFLVRNLGNSIWPAHGNEQGWYLVSLRNRWLESQSGKLVNDLDGRGDLPADLAPGGELQLTLAATAPRQPGDYILEIDMVHEGITFFREKGSETLKLRVRVGP